MQNQRLNLVEKTVFFRCLLIFQQHFDVYLLIKNIPLKTAKIIIHCNLDILKLQYATFLKMF